MQIVCCMWVVVRSKRPRREWQSMKDETDWRRTGRFQEEGRWSYCKERKIRRRRRPKYQRREHKRSSSKRSIEVVVNVVVFAGIPGGDIARAVKDVRRSMINKKGRKKGDAREEQEYKREDVRSSWKENISGICDAFEWCKTSVFSSLCVLSSDPETSRLEKRFVKEGRESKTKHKLEDLNYSRIQQYFGGESKCKGNTSWSKWNSSSWESCGIRWCKLCDLLCACVADALAFSSSSSLVCR